MVESTRELTGKDLFVAEFERRQGGGDHGWLSGLRRAALARFEALGFPIQRQEEWRFTSVAPLTRVAFQTPASGERAEAQAEPLAEAAALTGAECCRLVFVNGRLSRALSRLEGLDPAIQVASLAEALERDPVLVQPYLAELAPYADHPFVALNTAFFEDGAFVRVGRGRVIAEPLHLIYVTTADQPVHVHPRNLILVGENSQVRIMESYVGPAAAATLTNTVTELVAEENAVVDHLKVQGEGSGAFHFATLSARLGRSANFTSVAISTGAALARHDTTAVLDGEGGECSLNGLYLVRGGQHCDFHTRMEHAMPHCNSRQLYKGILDDTASGVFNGRIVVRPDAQKTDAIQSSRSLLLSREATVNTQPQLEIFADDVRCTHGAAVGALDDESIFYLRSRGIDAAAARGLLTYAFAGEVIDKIKVDALRERLEKMLVTRFKPGER